jgi:hypothetical protein
MWAPTTATGGMLARLVARQACAAMQQCAHATAATSSSTASAHSSEAPSTSGRDPSTWLIQQQRTCADPSLTILATGLLADMFRLWPTGPAVPKHLAEMSFEQLMDHWQTQKHRKFAMGELLTWVANLSRFSAAVTTLQLQSPAAMTRVPVQPCMSSCQHHPAGCHLPQPVSAACHLLLAPCQASQSCCSWHAKQLPQTSCSSCWMCCEPTTSTTGKQRPPSPTAATSAAPS